MFVGSIGSGARGEKEGAIRITAHFIGKGETLIGFSPDTKRSQA